MKGVWGEERGDEEKAWEEGEEHESVRRQMKRRGKGRKDGKG